MVSSVLDSLRESLADQRANAEQALRRLLVDFVDGQEVRPEELSEVLRDLRQTPDDFEAAAALVRHRRVWRAFIRQTMNTPVPAVELDDLRAEFDNFASQISGAPVDDPEAFRVHCRAIVKLAENLQWRADRALTITRVREHLILRTRAKAELLAEACRLKLLATERGAAEPSPADSLDKRYYVSLASIEARRILASNQDELEPLALTMADIPGKEEKAPAPAVADDNVVRWKTPNLARAPRELTPENSFAPTASAPIEDEDQPPIAAYMAGKAARESMSRPRNKAESPAG